MSSALSRRGFLAGAGGMALATLVPSPADATPKTASPDPAAPRSKTALSIRGADLSFLPQLEEAGVRYRDLAGRVRPAEQILAHEGANYMRLRVWIDPPPGYSDKARALALARRARRAGMKILLDPHYVLLAEVSYPWTFADGDGRGNIVGPDAYLPDVDHFPVTPAGQAAFYEAVRDVLAQVPDGNGLGFMAWEPEWVPGVGWQPGA
ncbi:MAG TPA: glycosyl hydrolase 53 family protein, partial [Actinoplanes sp.]|nr:glycosyl hydrolase 53 family protein [Actinoplanes sp.]